MHRRKPNSAKQRKAELQIKRAVKRGDLPPEAAAKKNPPTSKRGRGGGRLHARQTDINADASRRLESSFVKFSPSFLEEAKLKAASIKLSRPIHRDKCVYPLQTVNVIGDHQQSRSPKSSPTVCVLKRPKWNYEMSKKEVEKNEEGVFKRWLTETDRLLVTQTQMYNQTDTSRIQSDTVEGDNDLRTMPHASPLYERNLEVWRQLWRVTEISQILLILLDSRCPPLHYPASLDKYLSSFRPPRKVIFVLTKTDISGPEISSLWKRFLRDKYPGMRVVTVESYLERKAGEGQGKRKVYEPHIPVASRRDLVESLREVHAELCTPPPYLNPGTKEYDEWRPKVPRTIDWDLVLHAGNDEVTHRREEVPHDSEKEDLSTSEIPIEDFLSIGLIGQPNVGKSSLLNALFGTHKVKASRTPGKTKHFQTLFWTKRIRLVDCPGLVFPSHANLEMQVMAGILPISQMPAIPSSVFYALQYLPLENIFQLEHPAEKDAIIEDKRTWRDGKRLNAAPAHTPREWTTMDVLSAFAVKKGWITAKAGRPDINRAGNLILRIIAEGRIKWAFYPPDTDSHSVKNVEGNGIWLSGNEEDEIDIENDANSVSSGLDFEEIASALESESDLDSVSGTFEDLEEGRSGKIALGTGMFAALSLQEDYGSEGDSEDA